MGRVWGGGGEGGGGQGAGLSVPYRYLPDQATTPPVLVCLPCPNRPTAAAAAAAARYWQLDPPTERCVRGALIESHQALNGSFREFVKATPYVDNYLYVDVFYNMHVDAYKQCCCPGVPAPYITWELIFYGAGELLPCVSTSAAGELSQILNFGRCGGGW